jgi:hypothetical protein
MRQSKTIPLSEAIECTVSVVAAGVNRLERIMQYFQENRKNLIGRS